MSTALVLLPDFLLIVAGALLARLRAFDAVFWAGAERLVYFVLFPALLFRSLAGGASVIGDRCRCSRPGSRSRYRGSLCRYWPDRCSGCQRLSSPRAFNVVSGSIPTSPWR
jgi:hypothetical protein